MLAFSKSSKKTNMTNNQSNDQTQGEDQEQVNDATAEEPVTDKTPENESEATPTSKTDETDQVVNEEKEALENSKNPERTKEYIDKLKRELEEARKGTTRPDEDSVFDSFRSKGASQAGAPNLENLNQQQVDSITDQFIDENGNVDIAGLNKALTDANQRAAQAESRVQQVEDRVTRFEETRQVQEAHSSHPELDPKSESFDPKFYDLVKDRLLRNMYDGKQETLLQVANDIKGIYGGTSSKKEVSPEEIKKVEEAREQGPLETGRGEPRSSTGDIKELRERTRAGDARALDERLKNLGIL